MPSYRETQKGFRLRNGYLIARRAVSPNDCPKGFFVGEL